MAYLLLAKLAVALHAGFVVFVFAGGTLVGSRRYVAWAHLPCVLWAVLITIFGWPCPLTLLEQWSLTQAGAPVYSGEFLPYYVWSPFGLSGAETPLAAGLILALVGTNFRPYRALLHSKRRESAV